MPKFAVMLLVALLASGCSDPFESDVDKSRIIFQGGEFDAFEERSGLTAEEARELVDNHIKKTGSTAFPAGSCVVFDKQYFFSIEQSNKLGALSLNGYYVEPVKRSVIFKCPNLTYRPQ